MPNIIKKQNVFGWIAFGAAVMALVAMIVYIVSGTTGYMAGQKLDALPIVFTVISFVGLPVILVFSDKLDRRITGALLFVITILLAISLCLFIMARLDLFADIYFIPVNYPDSEVTSLNATIVGIVFYLISIVAVIVTGFAEKLYKE